MRFVLGLLLVLSTTKTYSHNEDSKLQFVQSILELDFSKSYQEVIDSSLPPIYLAISTIIENAGQQPEEDSIVFGQYSKEATLESLILQGAYLLFNEPSNSTTFEVLADAMEIAQYQNDKSSLKLIHFLMLNLYEQEIVQSSDDYKEFLNRFGELASSTIDSAWYHIHHVRYWSKSFNIDEADMNLHITVRDMKEYFRRHPKLGTINGYFYFLQGIYERKFGSDNSAINYYLKALEISSGSNFLEYISFSSLIHLGYIYAKTSQFEKALYNFEEAKNYSNASDSLKSMFILNRQMAVWYFQPLGLYDSAYIYLERSSRQEHFLDFRNNTLKISQMRVALETSEKEKEILRQETKLNRQQGWIWTIASFIGVLSLLIVVLIYSLVKIRAKNEQIEVLMRELHHRVKNNLQVVSSLLGLQSMKLTDENAKRAVSEGKGRILAMSLIHQKLYQKSVITSLNVREYLESLVEQIAHAYDPSNRVNLNIQLKNEEIDMDTGLPIGLIVNELVTNSFKYAFEAKFGHITVNLKQEGDINYILQVTDNGRGLPDDFDLESATSFGLKLVQILTKQINGKVQIENSEGFNCSIHFPVKTSQR